MISSIAVNTIQSTILPKVDHLTATLKGRSYTHWSEKLTIASAAFGVACAVVGFVLKNTLFGVFGTLLGITNGLAAFFLRKFLPLKALEGHVKDLTVQVDRVDDHLDSLKASNKQLQSFKDQFGPLLEEAQKAQVVMEKRLEDKTSAWERVIKDFQESEKKLEAVNTVLIKIQEINSHLNSQISTLEADRETFKENIENLNRQVYQLQEIEKSYKEENKRLKETSDATIKESEGLFKQLNSLQGEMGNLKETTDKLTQERTSLEKQVTELKTSLEIANQTAERAAKEAASYAQAAKALEEASKQIQQKTEDLKKNLKPENIDDLVKEIMSS